MDLVKKMKNRYFTDLTLGHQKYRQLVSCTWLFYLHKNDENSVFPVVQTLQCSVL
jgi:hypothetical protein